MVNIYIKKRNNNINTNKKGGKNTKNIKDLMLWQAK